MRRAWGRATVAAVAFIALAWVGESLIVGPVGRSERRIDDVVRMIRKMENRKMPVYKSTWVSAGGITREVTTPRNDGETADSHAARHKVDVDALKSLHPPI